MLQRDYTEDTLVSKLSPAEWEMIEIMVAVKAQMSSKRKEIDRARATQRADK